MSKRRNFLDEIKGLDDKNESQEPDYAILGRPFKYDPKISPEDNVRRALMDDVGVLVINDEVEDNG